MSDDYTDTSATTGTVSATRWEYSYGEIETTGDVDWLAVDLQANRTYRFDLRAAWDTPPLSDPDILGIYNSSSTLIAGTANTSANTNRTGRSSRVEFMPKEAGTYYVAVGGHDGVVGKYRIMVHTVTDDFTANAASHGEVEVGGSATGRVHSRDDGRSDVDWFAVELVAGKSYRIDLKGSSTGDGTLADPHLRGIHDADGKLIAGTTNDDGGTGRNSTLNFTATADGTHYVAAGADRYLLGTYTLSVTELDDDFLNTTATEGTLAVGGSTTGRINFSGDTDWFAVTLEAGQTYRFDLKGAHLSDPYLRGIYDANGDRIAGTQDNNSGTGKDSRLEYTAPADATYYVAAGASGNGTGGYTLEVEEIADDYTTRTSTAGVVTVGGSATGNIQSGRDIDWFGVEMEAGRPYQIDVKGSWTNDGTLTDPHLYGVYNPNGRFIAGTQTWDGGEVTNSRLNFTATADGTYYVAAGGFQGKQGTYTVAVTALTDDFTAATSTSGAVTVGDSATGRINFFEDRDWFAVELESGRRYQFDLEGAATNAGTLPDPYLRGIYDPDGDLIARTQDNNSGTGANSRVEYRATADGTHYVSAGMYRGQAGTYTLSVTELQSDDFAATTNTDGTVVVGGSATGDVEVARDTDWFAVDLEADKTYRFDLKGSPTGDGTLFDTYLRGIYDENGDLIDGTKNDDGGYGYNSQVEFTPTADGTYYVSAGAFGGCTGTYTLLVVEDGL